MKVNVFYNTLLPKYYHATKKYQKTVLKALGKTAKLKGEVSVIITGDREILKINKQFLGHNYITDVISFNYPFTATTGEAEPFGDIFICFPQAKRQAKAQGCGSLREMLTLAAHGALHLVGHNDDTIAKRNAMNAVAEKIAASIL